MIILNHKQVLLIWDKMIIIIHLIWDKQLIGNKIWVNHQWVK